MSDHLGRVDLSACGDFILKSEPQQVTVPEDLRELYDLAKCGAFATLNKKIVSAIERLGAAEQRAQISGKIANAAMDGKATAEHAVACLRAERDKLKDQNLILLNNADAFESKWRTLLSQLGAAEQEYGALESEHSRIVGAMLTERERLRNQLTDAERNIAILTEGCEVWEKRYAELVAERDRLKEALDGRMRVFQEDAAEIKQLQAKVAELEGKL